MENIKSFESYGGPEENYSIEEKRLERLRNLLTPLITLPQLIDNNENGKFDDLIQSTVESCKEVIPLIRKALKDDITMDELYKLYTDPKNRR